MLSNKKPWFHHLADLCTILGRKRVILDRESKSPYLIRFYLISTRWLEPIFPSLSFNLVLHNFMRSDEDGLHDHPWTAWTRILKGGYWETTPAGTFWREPGSWRKIDKNDYHRIELDPEKAQGSTWSLFLMKRREKEWGFQDHHGNWIQWQEYINNREKYV